MSVRMQKQTVNSQPLLRDASDRLSSQRMSPSARQRENHESQRSPRGEDRHPRTALPAVVQWTGPGRAVVFVLAASSIWCLLAEMYGLVDMRTFFFAILVPATIALYGMALLDRARGDRRLWRAVVIGTLAGLAGAIAYDLFRLPFVCSDAWGAGRVGIPQMPLFKVFPRFGALILGQPVEQPTYSPAAHLIGWAYHFSNGATFGVMFAAMIGEATRRIRGGWPWAVLMAVGIECCLLFSPYAKFFDIPLTLRFVAVTLTAHLIFGVGMGLWFAWQSQRWPLRSSRLIPA